MKLCRLISLLLVAFLAFGAGVFAYAEESGDNAVSDDTGAVGESSAPSDSSETSDNGESSDVGGQNGNTYYVKYGYKPLVAYDGTQASDYIKGTTPSTAYVGAGGSHTVANNGYTFRDYVFAGWSDGSKVYQPGEVIYNINSNITLVATWMRPQRPEMTVVGILSYADGDEVLGSVSVPIGDTVILDEGTWQDGEGRIFSGGSKFLLSFNTVDFKKYSANEDTVKVSYNGNGVSSGVQSSFQVIPDGTFTVDGCYGEREGYTFIGWQDGEGKLYLAGDTCKASGTTVLTAQWQESSKPAPDYCSVTVNVGEGGSADPTGKTSVIKGDKITVNVSAEKGYKLSSVTRDGEELGVGGSYTLTVNSDTIINVSFQYVGGDTESEESVADASGEQSIDEGQESRPVEGAQSGTESNDDTADDDDSDDDSPNKVALALAILLCVVCIGFCGWFVAKTMKGKKRTNNNRR